MTGISAINLVVAFAAGTLSFLSPCMLPLVPGYLAVLGAGSSSTLLLRSFAFVCGFGSVFVLLGLGASVAGGRLLDAARPAEIVGGVALVLLGATLVEDRLVPSALRGRVGPALSAPAPGASAAFVFGAVFGSAWSPCIGPTLGAILTLAATGGEAASGAALLATFAAGLGLPFLALAALGGRATAVLPRLRRHGRAMRIGTGILLAAMGVLLATGTLSSLSARLAVIPGLDI